MKTFVSVLMCVMIATPMMADLISYVGNSYELPNGTVRPRAYTGWHYVDRLLLGVYVGHVAGQSVSIRVDAGSSTSWNLPYVAYETVVINATSGTATGEYNAWTEAKEIIKAVLEVAPRLIPSLI